jgi:AraC-like DNA-binding protein
MQRQIDFESQLDQMYAISGQISTLNAAKSYNLRKNNTSYMEIRASLQGINATHSFFNGVAFYSLAMPNWLYTDLGTYNTVFYRQYLMDGKFRMVSERLDRVRAGEWLLPGEIEWQKNSGADRVLQFIIPVPGNDGSFLIFDIPEQNLSGLLDAQPIPRGRGSSIDASTFTVLHDEKGRKLYPFLPVAPDMMDKIYVNQREPQQLLAVNGADYYQINAHSEIYDLYFTRVIEKDILLREIINLQRRFTAIMIVTALACGLLVYLVAFYNYQPIARLNELARKKISNIPGNLYGLEQATFVLEKMDERYLLLEKKRIQEQLMIRLIHGRVRIREQWESECANAGIHISVPYMYVAIMELSRLYPEKIDVWEEMQQLLTENYVLYGIEYPKQGNYLFLIGCPSDNHVMVKEKMLEVSGYLSRRMEGEPLRITIGGLCNTFAQIQRSYMQVIMASHFGDQSYKNGVLMFDELPHSGRPVGAGHLSGALQFVYPKAELASLYESIVGADLEKTLLVTDILIDMIRDQSYNTFLCNSLCYDILNTYIRAREELNIAHPVKNPIGEDNQISASADMETLIDMIYTIRDETVKQISMDEGKKKPKDNIATRVVEYIDRHYRDEFMYVSSVANEFDMSISNLSHQFKASTGTNLSDYISGKKMAYAKELLSGTGITVGDIAAKTGYNQTASFIRIFKSYMNMTPNEYRQLVQSDIRKGN